ncbi:ProQ/FINO family [Shigella sonnei]|nr:ProQ/FINO family [Shigella sonnei]
MTGRDEMDIKRIAWTAYYFLSLFKYFVKYFFPLDREDLLKLMELAKDSPDAKHFPRPSHWTREYTHECVEKIKALFPHLRAEGGGFIPLKIGINNDISAFLAEHPETELTMDEWLCAVSCITSRRVYLQRTAVAGVPRYGLDGHPKGQVSDSEAQSAGRRLATLEQKWLRMQAQQENISGQ